MLPDHVPISQMGIAGHMKGLPQYIGAAQDSFIADLAVGLSTGQIKTGAPCRCAPLLTLESLLTLEKRHPSSQLP